MAFITVWVRIACGMFFLCVSWSGQCVLCLCLIDYHLVFQGVEDRQHGGRAGNAGCFIFCFEGLSFSLHCCLTAVECMYCRSHVKLIMDISDSMLLLQRDPSLVLVVS